MTTLREAAEMALEVLKDINRLSLSPDGIALPGEIDTTMDLLRTALANSSPRKPMTDEDIDKVTDAQWATNNHKPIYAAYRAYARAVEAAHGIGGEE
jgi:hypothetical protein